MSDRAGDYIVGLFGAEDELLASLREEADRTGLPPIAISADEGRLLQVLLTCHRRATRARGRHARRLLGDLHGARAAAGRPACSRSRSTPEHAEFARRYVERAGLTDRIDVRVGRALDVLAVARRRTLRRHVPRRRQGAAADVLRLGAAAGAAGRADHRRQRAVGRPRVREDETDDKTRGVREFNRRMATDPRVLGIIVPTHDGVAVAVVR